MLPWLLQASTPKAPQVLQRLDTMLGIDWRQRLNDPWAYRNDVAQVLLSGIALALWEQLQADLPHPVAVAGYSVGEVAAFSIAGVFDAGSALDLAQMRAQAMERARHQQPASGLLAIKHLTEAALAPVMARFNLHLAIRLGPDRHIVGGIAHDLDAAEQALALEGIHVTRLGIHIASHTPLLAAAVPDLMAQLAPIPFLTPSTALICNAETSVVRRPQALRQAFAQQVAQTVDWAPCMDAMLERGVQCLLELGPGTTLSRLWNERYPHIPARSADEFQHPAAVTAWVHRILGG
jgi:[acyl-carrier-protein] S-malonyltransferase